MPTLDPDMTLTDTLRTFGFEHNQQSNGVFHDIVDASGVVVFEGRASDVWKWLRETGGCLGDGVKVPHLACCPYAAFI